MPRSIEEGVAEWNRRKEMVIREGVAKLPGCTIDVGKLISLMRKAVARDFVQDTAAQLVEQMLTIGSDLYCNYEALESHLRTTRMFRNYKSATNNRVGVSKGIRKRVEAMQSYCLGPFNRKDLSLLPPNSLVFPLGGVQKKGADGKLLEEFRPASDHTKSGFNLFSNPPSFSLTATQDVARMLHEGYSMAVGDIQNAFALIPLSPHIWKFMFFVWYNVYDADDDQEYLYANVFADFGSRGAPEAFRVLFVDVCVGIARSENVICPTREIPIHVDDFCVIDQCPDVADREMGSLMLFLNELGIQFKNGAFANADWLQIMLGFVWNARTLTRQLTESRRDQYVKDWRMHAQQKSLSLKERQSDIGRLHRAVYTLPPGSSVFMANVLMAIRGLSLPWQRRRVRKAEKSDLLAVASLLEANMGKGYYDFSRLRRAPSLYTDASKSRSYTGGGYVSLCGRYSFHKYASRAARKPIDFLEGDTVFAALSDLAPFLHHSVVPIFVDNQAFQLSGLKGWSRADRLNDILLNIFHLAVRHDFVVEWNWISTHDNYLADALSRSPADGYGEQTFIILLHQHMPWLVHSLMRHQSAGQLRQLGSTYSSNSLRDGPSQGRAPPFHSSVAYQPVSIFEALDPVTQASVDRLMDNRLAPRSMAVVDSAMSHWSRFCERQGWERLIHSGSTDRGSKLAAFVVYLVEDTELGFKSIENYVWGVRAWQKLQRQHDPIYGVVEWPDFMQAAAVRTWVASEPRRAIPLQMIAEMLALVDVNNFVEVQVAVVSLIFLFTFCRSETPLPETLSSLDPNKHLQVKDVQLVPPGSQVGRSFTDRLALAVLLKGIKQDNRMERAAARHGGDWKYVGEVDHPLFNIISWIQHFFRHVGIRHEGARDPEGPFFLHRDGVQPYTYPAYKDDLNSLLRRCPSFDDQKYGPHGFRVEGYNLAKKSHKLPENLEVAQGGWQSGSERPYDRFYASEILSIPSAIISHSQAVPQPALPGSPASVERQPVRSAPAERMGRAALRLSPANQPSLNIIARPPPAPPTPSATFSANPFSLPPLYVHVEAESDLPPGWWCEVRSRPGLARPYKWYTNGHQSAKSRLDAYRKADRTAGTTGS